MRTRWHLRLLLVAVVLLPSLAACDGDGTAVPAQPTVSQAMGTSDAAGQADTPTVALSATMTPTPEPTSEPSPEPSPTPLARFEPAACRFELPPGLDEGRDVECGYVLVPEDRSDQTSRTLRLAVGIFRYPMGDPEPDPIVYLEGGPGASSLEMVGLAFEDYFEPVFAAGRDLILFDQRGVGLSDPALDCPGVVELELEILDGTLDNRKLSDEEITALEVDALLECRQQLSTIADLSDYHTASNAADVNDLRLALGYERVNLWAVSYGTHLALDVMRDHPEGLRSVVLDSVVSPDASLPLEGAPNADRALRELFDGCAGDSLCAAAYPELEAILWESVDALNESPVHLDVTNPLTGIAYDAELDGDSLVALVIHFLYQTDLLPRLPQIIYAAHEGDYFWLARLIGVLLATQEVMSDGMHYSVLCHDEMPFATLEEQLDVLEDYPRLAPVFAYSNVGSVGFEVCAGWNAGYAPPVENQPVRSQVPALIMSGEYDPVCPPARGDGAAETLPNAFAFTYPGVGHGASTVEGCPRDMMIAFFLDPTSQPDAACVDQMHWPVFEVPGQGAGAVELVPFENAWMGIQGVVPEGWEELGMGIYQRGQSAADPTALLIQALPVDVEELAAIVTEPFGLEGLPQPEDQREANGITWNLYVLDLFGAPTDMALGQSEGLAMLVLLQCEPQERPELYEAVFLPVIDALVPAN